ncbi:hypothetical protein RBWH47_02250 [Rhodopirellula baltica WH47]|uniref:Uncharacterized protein n=1 Tax=Rhodopirellula baltica WH47 TaxID=991778 RepID=F2AVJ1_RHOBT|nr:hypothetical protein RBWH47_02250 [Rhodopirellula baltica WH47]
MDASGRLDARGARFWCNGYEDRQMAWRRNVRGRNNWGQLFYSGAASLIANCKVNIAN